MTTQPLATECGACRHTLNWHNPHCQVPDCPCAKFTEPKHAATTAPAGGGDPR